MKPLAPLLVSCLYLSLFGSQRGLAEDSPPPNVIVILADDMGYGDVEVLNPASKIPTPNLNRLAEGGMIFHDAHSPSAVCTPTRYGLLTGRYCWRSRLKSGVLLGYSEPLIEPGRPTIANRLAEAGYATGAVGKWHLGMALPRLPVEEQPSQDKNQKGRHRDPGIDYRGVISNGPTHHGFDSYFGVTASLDMPPYVFVRDDRFTMVPTLRQPAILFPHFVRAGPRAEDFVIADVLDRLATEAVQFIKTKSKQEPPYFLYLPLTGPHKPTQPHERFRGSTPLGEYGDFVHQVDWTVGQVLEAVDASGEAQNTMVVFTSDNGSYMYRYDKDRQPDHTDDDKIQGFRAENHLANGSLRGTKADVWEAGHRVPTFVRWPAQVKAGTSTETAVSLTDIYATLAEFAHVELSDDEAEDSLSWKNILLGKSARRGAPVINHSAAGIFAIRQDGWKLVAGNGSGGRQAPKGKPFEKPFELYQLDADLEETNNLAAEYPERVREMLSLLNVLREQGYSRPRGPR